MKTPDAHGEQTVAVDLGATHIRAALIGEDATILCKATISTPRSGVSGSAVTDAIIGLIERVTGENPTAIGVSSAGPLDIAEGACVRSPNMAFSYIPLVSPLQERFECPVSLINDANAGVIGECLAGAGIGHDPIVYLTFSTGLGGGVISGGRLLEGRGGNAAEVGHLFVDDRYGLECRCKNTGHWEAYASGGSLPRFFTAWREKEGISPCPFDTDAAKGIFAAAEAGDAIALKFMEALGRINARGISDLIVAYDPSIIILDGPVARSHSSMLIRHLTPHLDDYLPAPSIAVSPLGGDAPLLGAAHVAYHGGRFRE